MVDGVWGRCGARFRDSDTMIRSTEKLRLGWKFHLILWRFWSGPARTLNRNLSYIFSEPWKCLLSLSSLTKLQKIWLGRSASTKYQVKSLNTDIKATLRFFYFKVIIGCSAYAVVTNRTTHSVLHVPPQFLLFTWSPVRDKIQLKMQTYPNKSQDKVGITVHVCKEL